MENTASKTLVIVVATALVSALAPAGQLAATGNEQACTVHEPIRILEDHGPLGFTWDDPITGEKVYRPGSGVVAGDGTAASPYEIAGWCIPGSMYDPDSIEISMCGFGFDGPEPEHTGILVCGTTAHFVLHNTTANLWKHGTGIGNVSADTGAIEHTDHLNNTYQIRINDAPGISIRHNLIHGLDATEQLWSYRAIDGSSPGATIEHNRVVVAQRLVTVDGDGVRVAHNELSSASEAYVWSFGDGVEVVDNHLTDAFFPGDPYRAVSVGGDDILVEGNTVPGHQWYGIEAWGNGVEVAHNEIPGAGWTGVEVGGSDIRVHNNTVSNDSIGVSLDDTTDGAVVENVTVTGASTGLEAWGSNDTLWRYNKVSNYTDEGMLVDGASNTTVRHTNFEDTAGTALNATSAQDTVDAKHNWWGCADGPDDPACDDVVGDAVYDSWLTAPDPDAGSST